MTFFRPPSIRWQRHSPLDTHSAHSLLISLMRGLAALEVAAAHLRSEVFPGLREIDHPTLAYQLLAFATGFAHQAVVVFFLISGWLVGGSLLNKSAAAERPFLGAYAIDRATRLWTVLLPALALMLAIGCITGDALTGTFDMARDNPYSAAALAGNAVGLQTVLVENFAGNYALWSLANETWYYIQFPLLLLVFTGASRLRQLGAATVLVALGVALPMPITLYFTLWLAGALFSRLRIDCTRLQRIALVAIAAGCSIYFRIAGRNDDLNIDSFLQDLVHSLPLLAVLASMQRPLDRRARGVRWLAGVASVLSEFSFTLYVIHIPLIKLMRHIGFEVFGRQRLAPDAPRDYAIYAGMLALLLACAWLWYLLFESRTVRIRRAIKSALPVRRKPAKVASVR